MSKLRYFSLSEFDCNCCRGGRGVMDWKLLMKLDNMRHELGRPIVINSGFRCEDHNRNEKGGADSSHLIGKAVDIQVPDSSFRFEIIELAMKFGIDRIGVYRSFVHLDIDKAKPSRVIWYSHSRLKR